ncbi:hypothetical protein GGG16DRAFT_119981 [Schizophyllum commune]
MPSLAGQRASWRAPPLGRTLAPRQMPRCVAPIAAAALTVELRVPANAGHARALVGCAHVVEAGRRRANPPLRASHASAHAPPADAGTGRRAPPTRTPRAGTVDAAAARSPTLAGRGQQAASRRRSSSALARAIGWRLRGPSAW